MSAEKILNTSEKNLTPFMTPEESKNNTTNRVDINDLLARVRDRKNHEKKINLIFFGLFSALILIAGIILSLWELVFNYIFPYFGPPLPSGVTHVIFWEGSLISQVLQWIQFCELITNLFTLFSFWTS